jgi:Tol biopolymer transport system component
MDEGKPLDGKIIIRKFKKVDTTSYIIYTKIDTIYLNLSAGSHITKDTGYSIGDWLNKEDNFIGTEHIPGDNPMQYKCSIVKFDLHGKIIDRIYESEKGELAWPESTSRDDKYLLFSTHKKKNSRLNPLDGLTPELDIHVMDLTQKKIIRTIKKLGVSPNIDFDECPWLLDGKSFVYSVSGQTKVYSGSSLINPENKKPGVYLYSLDSDETKLIVEDGYNAVASPTNNQIAYEKDESVYVLDLDTQKEKMIFENDDKDERVIDIHWTPDGQSVYFALFEQQMIGIAQTYIEKLINVNTLEEVRFKKTGLGFRSYSWK